MLRSIKQLYGNKLGAADGDLGQVKDLYFDDQKNWAIRYLVADTGAWLPDRQVLLSPYALGRLDQAETALHVNLTRKQIENSPSIELHKPVSRQDEKAYYRYYGWPYYWQDDALWGMSGFPIWERPPRSLSSGATTANGSQAEDDDAHLRSAKTVNSYQIWAGNGLIGHVSDFMMDAHSWAIGQLVIRTGRLFGDKEVLIPTKHVDRISRNESTVFVSLSRHARASLLTDCAAA